MLGLAIATYTYEHSHGSISLDFIGYYMQYRWKSLERIIIYLLLASREEWLVTDIGLNENVIGFIIHVPFYLKIFSIYCEQFIMYILSYSICSDPDDALSLLPSIISLFY